ncbi:MAG: hypothetical protein S4CHLAM2_07390 [Chlamydiales bacterium]|nr:hypothetical protein [Chlamydiales bacterium]
MNVQTKSSAESLSLQKQIESGEKKKKFGTFGGVFVPTLLTILGVILFLREGWVVGNAGYLGGSLIILIAFAITGCTAVSMSGFVTNTRIGAGGAFSIISQALGLEVGGSIGIPLYFSQALAVCMYIFGFREGWLTLFSGHSPLLIDYAVYLGIFGITLVSTRFAFRIQYLILSLIVASLISVLLAAFFGSMQYPIQWWGHFEGSVENQFSGISFWGVFAVFFPASTGIMAGANMSGELKDPRKSIPKGTLAAVGVSLIVYLAVAFWLARSATPEELLNNYFVLIEKAFYSPVVLIGLLAATFSSALVSFIGAPRILEALGAHNIIFFGNWLSTRSRRGEPFHALLVTFVIVGLGLLARDLNLIAPLITMFFLITYSVINLVVLIEESIQLISYRPYLRVPKLFPLIGFLGCLFAMFIISPTFGLIAAAAIGIFYSLLLKRQLNSPFNDVRSGLFDAVAEWSAKKVILQKRESDRAWKPNFLLPIDSIDSLAGAFRLVAHLASPVGSVRLLGIQTQQDLREFEHELENAVDVYLKRKIFATSSLMEETEFADGIVRGMQALRGSFFRPNILFLELPKDVHLHQSLRRVIDVAAYSKMGVALIVYHPEARLGKEERINVWIPQPTNWEIEMKQGMVDLALLLGHRLHESWQGKLHLYMTVESRKDQQKAKKYLKRLVAVSRLRVVEQMVWVAPSFHEALEQAPSPDLTIMPMVNGKNIQEMWRLTKKTHSTCLLCQDSGNENAFA